MCGFPRTFVASIAHVLNNEGIPCVLWGQNLLQVHGVPTIISSVDFVIPDDCLTVGAKALKRIERLTHCPDESVCLFSSRERHSPPPIYHMHIEGSEVGVSLYLQSKTLWFLPPLERALSTPNELDLPPDYVLASDKSLPPWRPGRGLGVFKPDYDPVVIPKSHVLLEAYMRLYARDAAKRIGSFTIAMIGYMEMYVDDDGLLDANLLSEPIRSFYKELKEGQKPLRQWTKELRGILGIIKDDTESDVSDFD